MGVKFCVNVSVGEEKTVGGAVVDHSSPHHMLHGSLADEPNTGKISVNGHFIFYLW